MQKPIITVAAIGLFLLLPVGCEKTTVVDPPPAEGGFVPTDTLTLMIYEAFPPMPIPADNPLTKSGVDLGRLLFYDPILSGDSTQACGSCHTQAFAFSDNGRQFSEGIRGEMGTRNAPAIINAAWTPTMFWDGREPSLEHQALGPVPNPIEMDEEWEDAVAKLQAHPEYPDLFETAFGTREITSDLVVKAIAQFERTLVSQDAKLDKVNRHEAEWSDAEARGFLLFFTEKGDCFHCHGNVLATTNDFRNNGLDATFENDRGLGEITGDPLDDGKFKTPTLRNIEFTAPYMHDGRFETLEEVLEHYNSGGVWSKTVDPLIRIDDGLGLTEDEMQDIIVFLKALSDSTFLNNPAYANPFE